MMTTDDEQAHGSLTIGDGVARLKAAQVAVEHCDCAPIIKMNNADDLRLIFGKRIWYYSF